MMRYAQVETISDKKISTTDTKFIKDFKNYNQVTKNKVYYVLKFGKSVKCIILKTESEYLKRNYFRKIFKIIMNC